MRIPLELEHLVRSVHTDSSGDLDCDGLCLDSVIESDIDPKVVQKVVQKVVEVCKPASLSEYLSVIDSRKALEVEHYLRACALRLDLSSPSAFHHSV
jgi:hypothetical protein